METNFRVWSPELETYFVGHLSALKVVSFETLLFCPFHTQNGVSEEALVKFYYHYLWIKEIFTFKYFVENFLFKGTVLLF